MRGSVVAIFTAALAAASTARASECVPAGGFSPCLDPDTLWPSASPSGFAAIPASGLDAPAQFTVSLSVSTLARPAVLYAESPDPAGRELRLVRQTTDPTLLLASAPLPRLSLEAALPAAMLRSGTGTLAITSQNGPPLSRYAWRDPRVSVGYVLHRAGRRRAVAYSARSLLRLSLPLGNHAELAGERSFVVAPALVLAAERGRFRASSLVGSRMRQPVTLGDARLGTQLEFALGAGINALEGWLAISVEAFMLPTLVRQPSGGVLVPAEWLASVRTRLGRDDLEVECGGGTGLPLSTGRNAAGKVESFAGLGSPAWRALGSVRLRWP